MALWEASTLVSIFRDRNLCMRLIYSIYISEFILLDQESFNECINNILVLNKECHGLVQDFIDLIVNKCRQRFSLYFEGRDKYYNGDVLLNNYKFNELFSMSKFPNSVNISDNNCLVNDMLPLCYSNQLISVRIQFNLNIPKWLIIKYIKSNGELNIDEELKLSQFQLQKYILTFHCHHIKSGQVGQHQTQEFITSYWSYILLYFVKIKLFPLYLKYSENIITLLENKHELEYTYDIPWIDIWQLPFEEIKHYYLKAEMDLYLKYDNKYLSLHDENHFFTSSQHGTLPKMDFVNLLNIVVIPLKEPYQIDHKVSYLSLRTLINSAALTSPICEEFISDMNNVFKSR
ncbi:hypothetical protein QEN19_002880 [Hanseniaspora menglaensis]